MDLKEIPYLNVGWIYLVLANTVMEFSSSKKFRELLEKMSNY